MLRVCKFHPACLAHAVTWLFLAVAIFTGHENGDNDGQRREETARARNAG